MNRFLYIFFGLVLIVVLVALLWAAQTHNETVQSLPDIIADDFYPLLNKESIHDVHFGTIEDTAERLKEQYPYIEKIVVRKFDSGNEPITIYPPGYDLEHPQDPMEEDPSFIPKPLLDEEGDIIGALYIKINAQRMRLFYAAIAGSMVALVLVVGVGVYTIRSQEVEVRKTTTLLEEKQHELIHLERLALVGQITANLLHDLKKPVLNIRAETESMEEGEVRKSILEETDLFLGMVRELQLEGFLRKDQDHAEFLDVAELVERSLRLVKYAQDDVKVKIELPEELPFIFGQRHQLIQIFSNILLNAFQALEGAGNIQISASHTKEEEEQWLEIVIADDGPGIPYEVQEHIFDPFYSTRQFSESTGLGLYISKSIVESMGGTILVQSIPKHGTTFTIRFPISEEEVN